MNEVKLNKATADKIISFMDILIGAKGVTTAVELAAHMTTNINSLVVKRDEQFYDKWAFELLIEHHKDHHNPGYEAEIIKQSWYKFWNDSFNEYWVEEVIGKEEFPDWLNNQ